MPTLPLTREQVYELVWLDLATSEIGLALTLEDLWLLDDAQDRPLFVSTPTTVAAAWRVQGVYHGGPGKVMFPGLSWNGVTVVLEGMTFLACEFDDHDAPNAITATSTARIYDRMTLYEQLGAMPKRQVRVV